MLRLPRVEPARRAPLTAWAAVWVTLAVITFLLFQQDLFLLAVIGGWCGGIAFTRVFDLVVW